MGRLYCVLSLFRSGLLLFDDYQNAACGRSHVADSLERVHSSGDGVGRLEREGSGVVGVSADEDTVVAALSAAALAITVTASPEAKPAPQTIIGFPTAVAATAKLESTDMSGTADLTILTGALAMLPSAPLAKKPRCPTACAWLLSEPPTSSKDALNAPTPLAVTWAPAAPPNTICAS